MLFDVLARDVGSRDERARMSTRPSRRGRDDRRASSRSRCTAQMATIRALRGAGQRALPRREDARARAPLHRRGGGRRRRLRGAAARRLHHEHAPRPRPLPRQGRRRRPDVRRAARQGGRLLPRQGRLDAHRRPRERQPRRERDRRRLAPASRPAPRSRPKRRGTDQVAVCFFGDGALGQGLLYEVMNMASLWKLPVDLRLREQPLQRVHALPRGDRRRRSSTRAAAFGIARRRGRRPGRARRATRRRASSSRARARGEGPAFLLCNTYRYHGHHVGDVDRAYYRSKDEEQRWAASATRSRCSARWLVEQGLADDEALARDRGRGRRARSSGRRSSRSTRRSRTRAR